LIADTHGLLRRQAKDFLAGSDHIVHAGDIGGTVLLDELRAIAPTSVVRGNNDSEPWAQGIPENLRVGLGGIEIFVVHDRASLRGRVPPAGANVIVTGHSHKPMLDEWEGCLRVNPGSAGPQRFKLPISLADLRIEARTVAARILDLTSQQPLAELTIDFG
jgi:uncharacterized protein